MERLFDPPEERPDDRPPPDGPLAARMRPRTLDEFVGQEHLLGEGSALRARWSPATRTRWCSTGRRGPARPRSRGSPPSTPTPPSRSCPPCRPVAPRCARCSPAPRSAQGGRATIFFLDEIHRFNKAQQDALLPAVEEGLVTLIGATTENPYFEVNSALLSRTQIYQLEQLTSGHIETLLKRAIERGECPKVEVPDDVLAFLATRSNGDARTALNALELACSTAAGETVALADAEDAIQRKAVLYDKGGDQHYDYISAWIKATRGSDPDASLYYLAAMLEGGEDPRFIARRMIILASEDVGNADPQALPIAVAAAQAVEHVGLPEGWFPLAQGAIYLSLAPKSDAVKRAIGAVRSHIREHGAARPPAALQSAA